MNPRQFFPLGKAYGDAFCNRTQEVKELVGNMDNGKHVFLVAPRRYGKSSLCERAIEKSGLPATGIDLHVATSEKSLERIILKGIVDLIGKTTNVIEKTIQSIKFGFKNLKPRFLLEGSGFKLELEAQNQSTTPEILREALLLLDRILASKQQKAVLMIDEFQRVIEIAKDAGVEGGIRSAAQETKYLSLIFSGSNRHLVESIFQNEGRPLYKLCKKLKIDRISADHYEKHLHKAAITMWGNPISDDVFHKIMSVTERHPYYVNYICDALWSEIALPNVEQVTAIWTRIADEERSDLLGEFYSLTENQKKLLIYLATEKSEGIYTAEASKFMGMPVTSVPKALHILLTRDIIEEIAKGHYRVINPVYKLLLGEP